MSKNRIISVTVNALLVSIFNTDNMDRMMIQIVNNLLFLNNLVNTKPMAVILKIVKRLKLIKFTSQ